MTGQTPCAACGARDGDVVERHHDRHSGVDYMMRRCRACGLVYADPRRSVGADWYAAAIHDEPPLAPEHDCRFRQFFADIPMRIRLLDIGCGEGQFLRLARERGYEGVGFDWDERRVARARAAGLDASAADWEGFLASRRDGEFGAITLFDVLEHAPEPAALLRGLRRVLAPGGYLAITVPNEDRPLPFGREHYDSPPHHFTRWTRAAMRLFLEGADFVVQRQDASIHEISRLRDVMVLQLAIEPAARLARRVLYGPRAQSGASLSELARSTPESPVVRSRVRAILFSAYSGAARLVLWPAAAAAASWYRRTRPDCGDCLYTFARRDG